MSEGLVFAHYPMRAAPIPDGWMTCAIASIAESVTSGFPSGAHNSEGRGVPHIRPMNIDREGRFDLSEVKSVEGEVPKTLVAGDVLFNNTNSPELIGKTTVIPTSSPLAFSNHMTRIRLESGMNPAFVARQLHYLWMSGYFRHRCKHHVNQASIAAEPLAQSVPLIVPPPSEQERIADTLDELLSDLDAGVAALERVRVKLKQYRATVLKAAVEGALTAEWRAQHSATEPASALLARILTERRRRWEESQLAKFEAAGKAPPNDWRQKYPAPVAPDSTNLPPLPERWCWAAWQQVGMSQNGRPFPSAEYQTAGVRLLRPGNLYSNGYIGWNERNTRCMSPDYADHSPDHLVGEGELVINLTAQSLKDDFLGRVCLTSPGEHCLLNQRLARLTPIEVNPRFMLWLFKSSRFRAFVAELNTGSLIQHMFTSQLNDFVFSLPPIAEQAAIVEAVEDQLSVIDHLESNLEVKLSSTHLMRQSILRHAFTGQLVPQDPNDEPASELLKRITAEREIRARQAQAAKGAKPKARQSRTRVGKH
ncbi:MAG: restriction endonuclease subunit S [Planctomycetota bacterium]